jgi:hypothetical protein
MPVRVKNVTVWSDGCIYDHKMHRFLDVFRRQEGGEVAYGSDGPLDVRDLTEYVRIHEFQ